MRTTLLLLLFFAAITPSFAQNDIADIVNMDAFVVSAGLEDFDKEDFIAQVVEDTTFYQAFLNLKYFPHRSSGDLLVFNRSEDQKGSMYREATQFLSVNEEMWVEIELEKTNGRIRKRNGSWRYLTAEMYDDVFFPSEKEKVSNRIVSQEQELVSGSKIEKHKAQLKKMLFNPGTEIDNVPFIGDKLAIFSEEMVPYYDYAIFTTDWQDSIPCIAFSQFVKEGEENKVVIRDMTSYFHVDTREVIARTYRLADNTLFFSFDISIRVENTIQNGWLLPVKIEYDGFWNIPIPFTKAEVIEFELEFFDYNTNVGMYRE
ncbi:MAG: hypothetical protein LC664_05880 [Flavobacteriales bacterium]|nr:hypothetical protein [Flavobacteriales bacterium]